MHYRQVSLPWLNVSLHLVTRRGRETRLDYKALPYLDEITPKTFILYQILVHQIIHTPIALHWPHSSSGTVRMLIRDKILLQTHTHMWLHVCDRTFAFKTSVLPREPLATALSRTWHPGSVIGIHRIWSPHNPIHSTIRHVEGFGLVCIVANWYPCCTISTYTQFHTRFLFGKLCNSDALLPFPNGWTFVGQAKTLPLLNCCTVYGSFRSWPHTVYVRHSRLACGWGGRKNTNDGGDHKLFQASTVVLGSVFVRMVTFDLWFYG